MPTFTSPFDALTDTASEVLTEAAQAIANEAIQAAEEGGLSIVEFDDEEDIDPMSEEGPSAYPWQILRQATARARSSLDINYREPQSRSAIYVMFNEQNGTYYLRTRNSEELTGYGSEYNNSSYTPNLDELYVLISSTIRVGGHFRSVFPIRDSIEYTLLQNKLTQWAARRCGAPNNTAALDEFMNEATMPIESRARPANDHSFIIEYAPQDHVFYLNPPYNSLSSIGLGFTQEAGTDLDALYRRAFELCEIARITASDAGFNVWPRRNSNHYHNMVALHQSGSQFVINNYAQVKQALADIKANPTDPVNENTIVHITTYIMNKFYGNEYSSRMWITRMAEVKVIIERITGVNWITARDGGQTLVHPDNAIEVHTDSERRSVVSFYSTRYRMRECSECTQCHAVYIKDLIIAPDRSNRQVELCTYCIATSGWYRCSLCAGRYHHEDIGCPEIARMPIGHIYNYSQDVRAAIPKMYHMKEDKPVNGTYLRYGVELEVLVRENIMQSSASSAVGAAIKGHAIMKADSSLRNPNGNGGFEIVTVPATLEYHRQKLWNDFFKKKDCEGLTASQYVFAWNSRCCGTHVHITRAALDTMQLAKLCVFYNEGTNNAFLSKIAGRTVGPEASYCKTAKKKLRGNTITGDTTANDCNNHHDAITVSHRNNGKTVEIRIFRANATMHGVMRAIEFVDATVMWCKEVSAQDLNYRKFLDWFDKPQVRSKYPELWRHLLEMRYLTTPHKMPDNPFVVKRKRKSYMTKTPKLAPLTSDEVAA